MGTTAGQVVVMLEDHVRAQRVAVRHLLATSAGTDVDAAVVVAVLMRALKQPGEAVIEERLSEIHGVNIKARADEAIAKFGESAV